MNLRETVEALEAKNITVAVNLGAHEFCMLDSNCPLAIQLRRTVADAGITLEQLFEGFEQVTHRDPVDYSPVGFRAKVQFSVAGKTMEEDLSSIVTPVLKDKIKQKVEELDYLRRNVKDLGVQLYQSYLREIANQRVNRTLPQLKFSMGEMLEAKCTITSVDNNYVFLFSFEYKPEYIVYSGIRYAIKPSDIAKIKREAYIQFTITPANKIVKVRVVGKDGVKLEHYHGSREEDCWGNVKYPAKWDGKLKSLLVIAKSLIGALHTVNRGSILRSHPGGMPEIESLMERSTEIGREGERDTVQEVRAEVVRDGETWGGTAPHPGDEDGEDYDEQEAQPGHGAWGAGTRAGRGRQRAVPTTTINPTGIADRMIIRFGQTRAPDMEAVCRLCGSTYGSHYTTDEYGVECPREHRARTMGGGTPTPTHTTIRERFGQADPPTTAICRICGRTRGQHYTTIEHGTECREERDRRLRDA